MKKRENTGEQIYQQKRREILDKMYQVLLRAQRKVDDKKYREIVQKLQEESI